MRFTGNHPTPSDFSKKKCNVPPYFPKKQIKRSANLHALSVSLI